MKNLEDLLNNTDFSQDSMNKEAIKAMLLNTLKCEEQKKYASDGISMRKNRFRPYAVATAAALAVSILVAACGEDISRVIQQFTIGQNASFVVTGDGINIHFNPGESQAKLPDGHSAISIKFPETPFTYEAETD